MNYISMFGKGNQNNKDDFVKVIKPLAAALIAKDADWDESTLTCTGVVGLNVKILTSMAGFQSNMQKFIIGVKIEPIVDKWSISA